MQYRQVLNNILDTFNLSNNCKQLYMASFELGEESVGRLIEKLDMDRSSAYLAIDQLKVTGLIEVDETRRPKMVRAIEPRKLVGRVESRIQNLEEIFDSTYSLLPQLEAAYSSISPRPVMQSYSGKDGLRQIMENILDHHDEEIRMFTNQKSERKVFTKHDHEYFIRKRKQQNLAVRVIATDDEIARELQATDTQNLRKTKILKGQKPFGAEVYIYGGKVAMLSFSGEVIGFIVNSSDFVELMRWQFENLWETL